jgi:hypothetical protein
MVFELDGGIILVWPHRKACGDGENVDLPRPFLLE